MLKGMSLAQTNIHVMLFMYHQPTIDYGCESSKEEESVLCNEECLQLGNHLNMSKDLEAGIRNVLQVDENRKDALEKMP